MGVQHQNIHDKSREGSWGGGGFNTKIYMTNPGRVLGGSTPKHDTGRVLGGHNDQGGFLGVQHQNIVQGGFLGVQHQNIHVQGGFLGGGGGGGGGGVQHQNIHD